MSAEVIRLSRIKREMIERKRRKAQRKEGSVDEHAATSPTTVDDYRLLGIEHGIQYGNECFEACAAKSEEDGRAWLKRHSDRMDQVTRRFMENGATDEMLTAYISEATATMTGLANEIAADVAAKTPLTFARKPE